MTDGKDHPRLTTRLHRSVAIGARTIALLLALLPPLAFLGASVTRIQTELEVELEYVSAALGAVAARNPSHWAFEAERIAAVLQKAVQEDEEEARILFDRQGAVIVRSGVEPGWPTVSVSGDVLAFGEPVARLVIVKSLLELIEGTALIGLLSGLLSLLGFFVLRRLPERLLDEAMRQVTHLATHDVLTGLANRPVLMDRLGLALANARRDADEAVALLCLDLDRFKDVNDTLGHAMGDALLRQVGARLRAELRDTDTVARLGGDEFAIIQPASNHPHAAEVLAQRIVDAVSQPFDLGPHQVVVGVTVGIALARGRSHASADALLADADTALYAAKREGRGIFRFFAEEMNVALRERRAMEADLRSALKRGEFALHYQPQVALGSGRVTGVEALLRWTHPTRGSVRPDAFIPLAEEIGLLPEIGAWVLRTACADALRWENAKVAVNVSVHQIHAGGFETLVARALDETGLPAARLEIEITEGVLLTHTEATVRTLEQIRALGVTVAMDDFGTGYSSLGYLQRFRFDKLKIDRSFVASLDEDPRAAAIVDAVLGITRALGVRANAEGVETQEQARMLTERGCDEAQGWLYGRPVPAEEIDRLLATKVPAAAD
jgi:diguanylate cyclase (GGDEF)-like protein